MKKYTIYNKVTKDTFTSVIQKEVYEKLKFILSVPEHVGNVTVTEVYPDYLHSCMCTYVNKQPTANQYKPEDKTSDYQIY